MVYILEIVNNANEIRIVNNDINQIESGVPYYFEYNYGDNKKKHRKYFSNIFEDDHKISCFDDHYDNFMNDSKISQKI